MTHTTDPSSGLSRRDFIRTAAAATAAATFGAPFISRAWAAAAAKSPYNNLVPANRNVRLACVGAGGRAYSDITGLVNNGAEIVALCDVHFERAQRAFHEYPNIPRFRDFRVMLDEMHDRIDAVLVATPDHMHFTPALMAIERGKHVYVEKPLTHTIGEARALKAAAKKHGAVTQMGNQGHAKEGARLCKEWLDAGVIGTVREIHSWTDRPIWPQNIPWPDATAGNAKNTNAKNPKTKARASKTLSPATLDWNLWLGVAPAREFIPDLAPFNWRGFWDYGCGALGDMGCHIMDTPFWAFNLTGNCTVSADAEGGSAVCGPKASTITYEYPARGPLPPVKYTWYDGGRTPPKPEGYDSNKKLAKGGTIYIGTDGILISEDDYGGSPRLLPESRMKAFTKRPDKTIPRVPKGDCHLEWLTAIKGGLAPGSNIIDYSADLTEFVSLGNLALRAGKTIQWDAAAAACPGTPETQVLINKNYRIY